MEDNKAVIAKLRQDVQGLAQKYASFHPETLLDKAMTALAHQQLKALVTLLSAGENIAFTELSSFLRSHWQLIKQTALGYTALPCCDLTLIMCRVAEIAAVLSRAAGADGKPLTALQCLMPDISMISYKEHYPDLVVEADNIPVILKTHIISQNGRYLLPVKLLTEWQPGLREALQKIGVPYVDYTLEMDEYGGYLVAKNTVVFSIILI